jgi:hypothetical protein
MSQTGASFAAGHSAAAVDDEGVAQSPVAVYSCSRLGRVANPPSFSLADWFRSARRR